MSLLLEALKKAEQKKQLLEQHQSQDSNNAPVDHNASTEQQPNKTNIEDSDEAIGEENSLDLDISDELGELGDELDFEVAAEYADEIDVKESDKTASLANTISQETISHESISEPLSFSEKSPITTTETEQELESESDSSISKNTEENTPQDSDPIDNTQELNNSSENKQPDSQQQTTGISPPTELHQNNNKLNNTPSADALNQLIQQQNNSIKKSSRTTILLLILLGLVLVLSSGYHLYTKLLQNPDIAKMSYLDFFDQSNPENEFYEDLPPDTDTEINTTNPVETPIKPNLKTNSQLDSQAKLNLPLEAEIQKVEIDQTSAISSVVTKENVETAIESSTNKQIPEQKNTIPREPKVESKINQNQNLDEQITLINDDDQNTWADVKLSQEELSQPQNDSLDKPQDSSNNNKTSGNVQLHQETNNLFRISKRRITSKVLSLTQQAYQLYQQGKYQQAKKIYQQVLTQKPNYQDALLGLAAIAIHNNQSLKAKQYYQHVLNNYPDNPTASIALNQIKRTISPLETEHTLKNKLKSDPENILFQSSIGNFYASQERWKLAQTHYFNAFSLDTSNIINCYNLAISLDNLGKTKQAIKYYNKALRLADADKNLLVPFKQQVLTTRIQQLQRQSK